MNERAQELIRLLELEPHPEGGFYREMFRSRVQVQPDDERGARAALTTIFFLLPQGAYSRWHRVRSDEVWHYYEGAPLELLCDAQRFFLGPVDRAQLPVRTIPAGAWQAARSTGAYTLVGCTVGPGFDFQDFVLRDDPPFTDAAPRCESEPHP